MKLIRLVFQFPVLSGVVYLCCTEQPLMAQSPVLTATNTTMKVGEVFTAHGVPYSNPGPSGANQMWDFPGLSPDRTLIKTQ